MNLVNKDQLEILAALRESVNEDKCGLETEVKKLQDQVRDLKEKNKMQLEQVNALLMEKVSLQSDSMTQREKMLERERTFACAISDLIIISHADASCRCLTVTCAHLLAGETYPRTSKLDSRHFMRRTLCSRRRIEQTSRC